MTPSDDDGKLEVVHCFAPTEGRRRIGVIENSGDGFEVLALERPNLRPKASLTAGPRQRQSHPRASIPRLLVNAVLGFVKPHGTACDLQVASQPVPPEGATWPDDNRSGGIRMLRTKGLAAPRSLIPQWEREGSPFGVRAAHDDDRRGRRVGFRTLRLSRRPPQLVFTHGQSQISDDGRRPHGAHPR